MRSSESELQEKITVREALELYSAFYPNPADWRALADDLGLTPKLKSRFGRLAGCAPSRWLADEFGFVQA